MPSPKTLSSDRKDWQTPPEIIEVVKEFAGGQIWLDPCGAPNNPVGAEVCIYPPDNGLETSWVKPDSIVFANPPYGSELPSWAANAADEGANGAEVILLCPPRTDTRWFRDHVFDAASAIAFWHGGNGMTSRIQFLDASTGKPPTRIDPKTGRETKGGNTTPSVFAYYGPRPMRFGRVFGQYSRIVFP